MRRVSIVLGLLFLLFLAGGLLIAWSGLVPIAASSGHWQITSWFLHFTMRRSVQVSAMGITPPPLDDPAFTLRGAGHYELGCAPCHGAPGVKASLVARQMTPAPPYLPDRIDRWQANELFWIVKHGIKFSGMPAWTAQQREDEVWALVAFLRRLPTMSPERYRQLALNAGQRGSEDPYTGLDLTAAAGSLEDLRETCARCHGADGKGREGSSVPRLAGQTAHYILASLRAYGKGERHSGIMQPVATTLSDEQMTTLARHFASVQARPQVANSVSGESERSARGRAIALDGLPRQGVPACTECHGPKDGPRNPHFPILAGQHQSYLALQLELFAEGRRGGTPYAHLMQTIAGRLTPQQRQDVAAYFATLPTSPVLGR